MLAHVWSHTQKISQESNYPDLGQDKWDCKKHVDEGREDKYCKTWLVRGTTGGQGGTFQLFALSPSCSIGRGVCKRNLRRSVMLSGFLRATSPATLAAKSGGGNPSAELLHIPLLQSQGIFPVLAIPSGQLRPRMCARWQSVKEERFQFNFISTSHPSC